MKDVEQTNLLYLENTKNLRFYTNESILLLCFVLLSAVCVYALPCISSATSLVRLTPIIVQVAGRSLHVGKVLVLRRFGFTSKANIYRNERYSIHLNPNNHASYSASQYICYTIGTKQVKVCYDRKVHLERLLPTPTLTLTPQTSGSISLIGCGISGAKDLSGTYGSPKVRQNEALTGHTALPILDGLIC